MAIKILPPAPATAVNVHSGLNHASENEMDLDDVDLLLESARPSKGAPSSARKAPPAAASDEQSTPQPDSKPPLHASASNLRAEYLRADSEVHDATSAGFSTPPPAGNGTPLGVNGVHGSGALGSQADVMEIDSIGHSAVASALAI